LVNQHGIDGRLIMTPFDLLLYWKFARLELSFDVEGEEEKT
jgi:hypothetical protein